MTVHEYIPQAEVPSRSNYLSDGIVTSPEHKKAKKQPPIASYCSANLAPTSLNFCRIDGVIGNLLKTLDTDRLVAPFKPYSNCGI